jgi:hypothetical protein
MTDKESLKGIEQEVQIEERTRHAMETYVNWLENAMSASPWSNVDFNKKLLSYATDNVTAAVGLVEKLSHAKKSGRRGENSNRIYESTTEFLHRADQNHHGDLYESGTGYDEAFSLKGNLQ